ncbi:interleukin-12 subunit beta [Syngnathus typhle]
MISMRRIFGLLLISLMGVNGLNYFPKSFVTAKINASVTLPCGAAIDGDEVTWTFKGNDLDEDYQDEVQRAGANLLVKEVGRPLLGEYTCWSGGESASVHLLLEAEEEGELDSFLTCRAKSYNCAFSCTWLDNKYKVVRLGLDPHCREGGDSCSWVKSTVEQQDGRLHFELRHSLSPYSEESTRLELTAEALENNSLLRRTKTFYLRDIIQPDSPEIVQCQEVDHGLSVTVRPPSSWSTPHSFFGLEHEVEYEHKDDGKKGRSSLSSVPKKISRLRVRSRDELVQSAWSQWTEWTNVQGGKRKRCKAKKTAMYI